MRTHRVLVCGGRKFGVDPLPWEDHTKAKKQRLQLARTLDWLNNKCIIEVVIDGEAKGADDLGYRWAKYNKLETLRFPADWNKHGKAAGFKRNQQMIDEGNPTLVVAFAGGNGTRDMIQRARTAGIPVLEIKDV
jgi:hypothetical protein